MRESRAAADEIHYKRGTFHTQKRANYWARPPLEHLRSIAKHMPPRLLNVRIGPLISSNCGNRRIRKWKWCSFRHQTLPGWAIVWAIVWVFSAQENNRCRISLLISSNWRNRRIRKWKWCSCRRQTIPGWAIVLAIVWVILRANGPGSSAELKWIIMSPPVCFRLFCVSVFSVPSAEGRLRS